LKTIEDGFTEGIVLEAYQNSKGLNAMTMIVKQGTLKVGSLLVIGEDYAKVKSFHDDQGMSLKEAKPGDAVQVIGIPNIPAAGDFIYEVSDENKAKFITSKRKQMSTHDLNKEQQKNTVRTAKIRLDYRSRKSMYGSASNDAWLLKFEEK
jgi:translation initiation factor IF-2